MNNLQKFVMNKTNVNGVLEGDYTRNEWDVRK